MSNSSLVPAVSGGSPSNGTTRLDSTVITYPNDHWQVIISGKHFELRHREKPPRKGVKPYTKKLKKSKKLSIRSEEYKKRNATKTFNDFRRKFHSNFGDDSKFLTLTFRDGLPFNIRSLKDTRRELNYFVKRLRIKFPDQKIKYIAVAEFQDKNGRGAVHFHLVINLPYILNEDLEQIWGNGFIKIMLINKNDFSRHGVNYLAKYLNKNSFDPRFEGQRKYSTSGNLEKPIIVDGEKAQVLAEKIIKSNLKPTFENQYPSYFHGEIYFLEYNLEDPLNKA